MSLLEKSWEQREEKVYKELFGDLGSGIYPLDADIFTKNFNQESCDPRWLNYGVFKSPPNGDRKTWLYVSSGMSNPWETDEPEEYSGFGTEFVLETHEDADWAINMVRILIAYNILLAHGKMGDFPMLDYGHRVPFKIIRENDAEPVLTHVMLVKPVHYEKTFKLISGDVDFLHMIGITGPEYEYSKENSSEELFDVLKKDGVYPITDRDRTSTI